MTAPKLAYYCATCGHHLDRHEHVSYYGSPCTARIKGGSVCTCRGYVRIVPKSKELSPKKEGPKPKAEDCMNEPPPKTGG